MPTLRVVKTVAYCNPLVPAEWIEAHALRAAWVVPRDGAASAETGSLAGMCAYARAIVDTLGSLDENTLAVLTTTCDQMRRAAGLLAERRPEGVFLLNVPRTHDSPASRTYYADELRRLGRWLVDRGGQAPAAKQLADVMIRHDAACGAFRRGELPAAAPPWCNPVAVELAAEMKAAGDGGVPLGLVGGPLRRRDLAIAHGIHAAGGRIAFDATCGGQRTLADALDPAAVERDPVGELVRAYFDHIPTISERPADRLHAWLTRQITGRHVRGLVCVRHVWCDLWRAVVPRLKETAGVPILEIDLGDEDRGGEGRLAQRLEAMIESLHRRGP